MCVQKKDVQFLVVDLFCGAGGTTTGFEHLPEFKVVACVNHDANAIRSHEANHPDCLHFTEDITVLYDIADKFSLLIGAVEKYKKLYPNVKVVLWASLECTNFSKAKGGLPRDADSRTLADHLPMYINPLQPDYVMIENVVEFMAWGPLDENGKPVCSKNGVDFKRWCAEVDSLGYRNEWRQLNAADFGAYQSRNRLFGCFAKKGLPIKWPSSTHAKVLGKVKTSLFQQMPELKPWMPVREVLDLNDEGVSIFDRKKPLVDRTLERIYAGLIKFVAGGKDKFLVKYNSMKNRSYSAPDIEEPSPVIPTRNTMYVAFISKAFSGHPESKVISIDGPSGTIKTIDNHSLVRCEFIQSYYGNGGAHSVDEPCPTVSTHDRFGKVFVMRDFISGANVSSVDSVCGALTCNPKTNLVTAVPFVMNTNFRNEPSGVDVPCTTITANRKWHYIVNPQYRNIGNSVDAPAPTLIARQDKSPISLAVVIGENENAVVAVRIDEGDSEVMIKIKEFMAMYNITDIKMRMFRIEELLQIQGFPKDYKLVGSQADQKKFIGNAVHTIMPAVLGKCYL